MRTVDSAKLMADGKPRNSLAQSETAVVFCFAQFAFGGMAFCKTLYQILLALFFTGPTQLAAIQME